MFVMKLSITG